MRHQLLLLLFAFLLIGCGVTTTIETEPNNTSEGESEVAAIEVPVEETEMAESEGEPETAATEIPVEEAETVAVEPTEPLVMPTNPSDAEPAEEIDRVPLLSPLAPEGTEIWPASPERGHDENITYPFGGNPLPGGIHHPVWQKCGVYYAPVYTQLAIHAMEHGAVWITYNPETVVGADVASLANYADQQPFVLISPYPEQDSLIAVTAWGLQLLVEAPDDERIQQFIEAFANGPQNPEPGANCEQGVTETIAGE